MGEADLAVIEQPLGAGRAKGGRDIDHVDVGEGDRELGQRHIGQAEARAMSLDAALGQAQRLNGRFGQIVDQDRRRGHLAQVRSEAGWHAQCRRRAG